MKPKILIIVIARVIMSISNPAIAQQLSSDPPSRANELYPPITISWHYPSIFETDASHMMEESMLHDLLPVDSVSNNGFLKLEKAPEDDHCEEVKMDLSSTCAGDYKFVNEPVMIQ